MPIYLQGKAPQTAEERYQQLFGLAYAPLTIDEILSSIKTADAQVQLDVIDIAFNPQQAFLKQQLQIRR